MPNEPRRRSVAVALAGAVLALARPAVGSDVGATVKVPAQLSRGQLAAGRSNYVELCGGCHGISGTSAPARVPELKGRVGHFLCIPQGREYLIRLPNVSHAALADPADLAALMNYVVFVLGDGSAPTDATPFRAEEVAALRSRPLDRASLRRERSRLVSAMLRQCPGVPTSMRNFYVAPGAAPVPAS